MNFNLPDCLAEQLPLRILLAEDNVVNQKVAANILLKLGYRADVAANGVEVLDALARQPYDVVLMDIQMPEMDGLEATRQIISRYPKATQPYIIAMTANAMQGDRDTCLAVGMQDYLSKPIRLQALVNALQKVRLPSLPPRTPRPQPSDSPVLDRDVLAELKMIGGDGADQLMADLIDSYLADAPQLLTLLETALASDDLPQIRHAAHTLKSSSASLGATELAKLCKTIEKQAREGTISDKQQLLSATMTAYAAVKSAMETERQKYVS
jgi:CheY-like chemotaxis protein/HPt (histidine-containing phosphotransfer) domain-containing protein